MRFSDVLATGCVADHDRHRITTLYLNVLKMIKILEDEVDQQQQNPIFVHRSDSNPIGVGNSPQTKRDLVVDKTSIDVDVLSCDLVPVFGA